MELLLLGPPLVIRDGQPIRFDRRQPLALLAYLACAHEPVSRDHLAFLFWPDIPQAQARHRLRRVLHQLHLALNDDTVASILESTSETLALRHHLCRADVRVFAQLAQAIHGQAPAEVIRLATQALALYRGPFLDSFTLRAAPEFERWMLEQREQLQQRSWHIWRALVLAQLEQGQIAQARAAAEQWLTADRLAEEAYRLLMQLYAESGQTSAALRLYQQCAAVLAQELGVEPAPETQALYERIRSGMFSHAGAPARAARPGHTQTIARRLRPTLEAPCVGRARELARVRAAVQASLHGRPQVVALCGPPGIGKTRVIQEALAAVAHPIWAGSGHHAGPLIPYGVIVEALQEALQESHPERLALPDAWRQEAARLFPVLRPPAWQLLPDLPPEQAQARLFEALIHVVRALVRHSGGAVLVCDDGEEADALSLAWLSALAAQAHGLPLAMVLAYQDEVATPALRTCLAELTRLGLLCEVRLAPLEVADVAELIGHAAPHLPTATLAPVVWEASGGIPFFVLEGVRAVLNSGNGATIPDAATLPITADLSETLQARIERLETVTRQVLEACAVLRRPLRTALIQYVSGRSELEVADGLDDLVRRDFLRAEAGRMYHFTHGFLARVAYQAIGPARRQILHRRAATALRRHTPQQFTAIAEHFEQSDRPDEATLWWLQAGDQAWSLFAAEAALAAWERGLALASTAELKLTFLLRQEEVLHRLGRRQAQAAIFPSIEALAHEVAPQQQAVIAGRCGRYAAALNRWTEAEHHVRTALALPAPDSATRVELCLLLASSLTQLHRYDEAEAIAHDTWHAANAAGAPELQARALLTLAEIAQAREDVRAAGDWVRQALGLAVNDSSLRARMMAYLARLSYLSGTYDVALAYGTEALQIYEQQLDQEGQARCWTVLALALARLRRYSAAMDAYGRARTIYQAIQHLQGAAAASINAATLAMRMGDMPQGLVLAHQAHALFEQIQDGRGLCVAAANIGAALVWLGRGAEAEPWLREDIERAQALHLPLQEAAGLANLGAALLQQGQFEAACTAMEQGLALRQQLGAHVDTCADQAMLALGYLLGGDPSAAARYSQAAVAQMQTHSGVEHPQFILFVRALVLHALGNPEADVVLQEAAAALERELALLPNPADRERYHRALRVNAAIHTTLTTGQWPDPRAVV